MIRAWLFGGTCLLASSVAFAAPDEDVLAVGPGSYVYWASVYDGSSDRFREHIRLQGEGFEIYQNSDEYSDGTPADYYALFSGIYYAACDTEMPTAEERADLMGLWPLTEGNAVTISSDVGAIITVGEPAEFFLMGRTWPAHRVSVAYEGDDPSEESVIVLDQVPLTVTIDWEDESSDKVLLVTRPKPESAAELDPTLIGNCASLLTEQTE